jgi:hypothetical protein
MLHQVGHGERLAGTGHSEQNLTFQVVVQTVDELVDRFRLIAGRTEVGFDAELGQVEGTSRIRSDDLVKWWIIADEPEGAFSAKIELDATDPSWNAGLPLMSATAWGQEGRYALSYDRGQTRRSATTGGRDDDDGVGRDNRSADGVRMTGNQPDGALVHGPGPPAAAEVPLGSSLEQEF